MKLKFSIQNQVKRGPLIHLCVVYGTNQAGDGYYLGVNNSIGVVIGQPFECFYPLSPISIRQSCKLIRLILSSGFQIRFTFCYGVILCSTWQSAIQFFSGSFLCSLDDGVGYFQLYSSEQQWWYCTNQFVCWQERSQFKLGHPSQYQISPHI